MQHKKRTYNIGRFKHYLHSIPTLLLFIINIIMMKKNVKSNVLYSIPNTSSPSSGKAYSSKTSSGKYSSRSSFNKPNYSTCHSTNDIRWSSPHCTSKAYMLTNTISANRTRSSREMMSYSRIGRWTVYARQTVYACILVLLFGLTSMLSLFWIRSSSNVVYAEGTERTESFGDSSASMTLDTSKLEVSAELGNVSYASKEITINAVNVEQYTVTITGPTSLSGSTTFTGANNNTPATMPDNSWGYAYSDSLDNSSNGSDTNNSNNSNSGSNNNVLANLTYKSLTGTAQELERGTSSYGSTKTLAFAAKFGNDTIPGNYTADITLGLVALPSKVVFDGITTMQAMTPEICTRAELYDTSMLKDIRDNNWYKVTKLDDGRCWMTSNLALSAPAGGRVLTPEDSNVESNYTLPAENINNFNEDDTTQAVYLAKDANNTPTGYYSWCAATAGTCSSATSGGSNATSSICPKGWKLPTGGVSGNTDFYNLFKNIRLTISDSLGVGGGDTIWGPEDLSKVQGSPYNFAYTGNVYNGSYHNPSDSPYGRWWSGTASSGSVAYNLLIGGGSMGPGSNAVARRYGYAVRCIAEAKPQTETYTLNFECNMFSGYSGCTQDKLPTAKTCTTNTGSCEVTIDTEPKRNSIEINESGRNCTSFLNWQDKPGYPSAASAFYEPGQTITITGDTTLYARWLTPVAPCAA